MFTAVHQNIYQPLAWLTYALDHALWGLNPTGYHLSSLLIHCLSATLFYFLARRLLGLAAPASNDKSSWFLPLASAFAALLFSIHPLRVESVAWATERRDVLCGLFYIASLLSYINAPAEPRRWPLVSFIFFILALLSKATVVTLPLVLLILDVYPLRRTLTPRVLLEKIPYFLASLVMGLAVLEIMKGESIWTPRQFILSERAAHSAYSLAFYLGKTIFPFSLSPVYEVPLGFDPSQAIYSLCGVLVILITVFAVFRRKDMPALLACWMYYLTCLFLMMGLILAGTQFVADRNSYLSCMGIPLLAAGIWRGKLNRLQNTMFSWLPPALAIAALSFLAAATWRQTLVWRGPESLWTHALALNPDNITAHNNLGFHLAGQGRLAEAAAHFENALNLNPVCVNAQDRLIDLLQSNGDAGEIAQQHHLLTINSACRNARGNWINARAALGYSQDALNYYRQLSILQPDNANVFNNLGMALQGTGQRRQAGESFRRALALDPGHVQARANLDRLGK